jgi:hypothetical protein
MRLLWGVLLVLAPVYAQWVKYPTDGVPKNAEGKPNLTAPAPRTANGKPDFSGMWLPNDELPCPKMTLDDVGTCEERVLPSHQAANIAFGISGGLPFQPWAQELQKKRAAAGSSEDPHTHCLPSSFPKLYTFPHITKIIQTPKVIAMLNEFNASYRQIFTDGRALPDDPTPSWNGYSTAKWQGGELVVETIGFRDDLWMDASGTPLTNGGKVTERFRRPNFGTLEIQALVDDPKAYTKPWTVNLKMKIVLDTELMDEVCLEGERSLEHLKAK